jgi:hypothetical protein
MTTSWGAFSDQPRAKAADLFDSFQHQYISMDVIMVDDEDPADYISAVPREVWNKVRTHFNRSLE